MEEVTGISWWLNGDSPKVDSINEGSAREEEKRKGRVNYMS